MIKDNHHRNTSMIFSCGSDGYTTKLRVKNKKSYCNKLVNLKILCLFLVTNLNRIACFQDLTIVEPHVGYKKVLVTGM